MKFETYILNFLKSLTIFLLLTLSVGCSQPAKQMRPQIGAMDTPAFHTSAGDDALLAGDYQSAVKSFNQALSLDADSSPAQGGLAAAKAYQSAKPSITEASKLKVLEEAEELISKAINGADDDKSALVRVHNFAIQVYVALQLPKDSWYEKALDHFQEAVSLDANSSEAYFFSARAHATRLNYAKAVINYNKVLEIAGEYQEEANKELKLIQRIQRALPDSRFGASVANESEISRADVAALFIAELRLDWIYKAGASKTRETYTAPANQQKLKLDPLQKYPDAIDIAGHPMEGAILKIIKLGVRGLEPDPAHRFHPDQTITRAEFALVIQDILVKVTKNKSLETQFLGQPSPFPDVKNDVWSYNAIRTAVNRGLMSVSNKATGDFKPLESVSGADALLIIRSLKGILKSYLR